MNRTAKQSPLFRKLQVIFPMSAAAIGFGSLIMGFYTMHQRNEALEREILQKRELRKIHQSKNGIVETKTNQER